MTLTLGLVIAALCCGLALNVHDVYQAKAFRKAQSEAWAKWKQSQSQYLDDRLSTIWAKPATKIQSELAGDRKNRDEWENNIAGAQAKFIDRWLTTVQEVISA